MAKLSKELLDTIVAEAERIEYGDITLHLVEHTNVVDIEINERLRFLKEEPPKAGRVAYIRKVPRQG
jgi:hypothetical protein